jgi:hypothetical protein
MGGNFFRMLASEISPATAPVFLAVAVQKFAPVSADGHSHMECLPGHRREIADDQNGFAGRLSKKRKGAIGSIVGIDPLKPAGIAIQFV